MELKSPHLQQTTTTFSALFEAWQQGNSAAGDELVALVYQQLHMLASHYLRHEMVAPSIQTTDLIHETWVRLFAYETPSFENRAHFFVIAARQMRRILIDRARGFAAGRRIPKRVLLPLSEAREAFVAPDENLLLLDEALQQLEESMPRVGRVVELRYFAGLTEEKIAEILDVSLTTVKRDWTFAKLWLLDQLTDDSSAKKE